MKKITYTNTLVKEIGGGAEWLLTNNIISTI